MVMEAVKPPLEPLLQSLEVYETSQETAACAAVVCTATSPKAATKVAVAVTAHLRRPRGIFTSHHLLGGQRLTWERSQWCRRSAGVYSTRRSAMAVTRSHAR